MDDKLSDEREPAPWPLTFGAHHPGARARGFLRILEGEFVGQRGPGVGREEADIPADTEKKVMRTQCRSSSGQAIAEHSLDYMARQQNLELRVA